MIVTAAHVRLIRVAFLAVGPALDFLADAAAAGELPDAKRIARAGRYYAAHPDAPPMRAVARATRRTAAGVARRFPPLRLGLLLAVVHRVLPELFADEPRIAGIPDPSTFSGWVADPSPPLRA